MPVLAWRNDADGFAFVNSFTLDPTERAYLQGLSQPVILEAVALVTPIVGPIVALGLGAAAEAYMALGRMPTIGLCGGMAYASVDHWHAQVPLPRGAHSADQPTRTGPASTPVRDMIWERLVNSLTAGGVLRRTLEWSLVLNQVPEPFGGGPELLRRTVEEWDLLRAHIEAGEPWPLGLVYTGRSVWDQHQVVAYGYESYGYGGAKLYVYDPNTPHQYGSTAHSEITLDFSGPELSATSPSDFGDRLAGFFCSNYLPAAPPPGLAVHFGQFLSWTGDPRTWMVTDGARLPVASPAELTALGASAGDVRPTGQPFSARSEPPRDGALLKERSSDPVFLFAGGGPFHVPDPAALDSFGGAGAVRVVPDSTLAACAGPPRDGALLREVSDAKVYLIKNQQRCWLSTRIELAKHGGAPSVRPVPDGALASIPVGPALPPGGPTTTVPDVREDSKSYATRDILAADLVPAFTGPDGDNAWVRGQSPKGGTTVERGSTVTMQLQTGPVN
jgi:hypothetical protein